jgi:hypothetical protein
MDEWMAQSTARQIAFPSHRPGGAARNLRLLPDDAPRRNERSFDEFQQMFDRRRIVSNLRVCGRCLASPAWPGARCRIAVDQQVERSWDQVRQKGGARP